MINEKRSARDNARKHGIFAGLNGPGSAEAEEFQGLLLGAREAIRPTNGLEEVLIEKLAMLFLRLKRVYKADLEIAPQLFARVRDTFNTKSTIDLIGEDQIVRRDKDPTVDSVVRYETSIERQIGRTLSQIQQLRRMREIDAKPIPQDAQGSELQTSIVSQQPGTHP